MERPDQFISVARILLYPFDYYTFIDHTQRPGSSSTWKLSPRIKFPRTLTKNMAQSLSPPLELKRGSRTGITQPTPDTLWCTVTFSRRTRQEAAASAGSG
jgi:hypothetical protein